MKPDHADEIIARWRVEMPEIAGLALEVAKRTARLAAMLDTASNSELDRLGLTKAEYEILATLRRIGAPFRMRPTDLTAALLLSSGGTSNVIKRLIDEGYVKRCDDPEDRRSSWVELTKQGVTIAETAVRDAVAAHEALLARVPNQNVRALARLLREVLLALGDSGATDARLA